MSAQHVSREVTIEFSDGPTHQRGRSAAAFQNARYEEAKRTDPAGVRAYEAAAEARRAGRQRV